MSEQKIYCAPYIDINELSKKLEESFKKDKYDTQAFKAPNDGTTVQLRQKGSWRSALGMSSALTVTLTKQNENLIVDIGAAKWGEKAAVGAVGAVVFFPALITAAYGAWKQSQLPDQVFELIEQQIQLCQGASTQEIGTGNASNITCPSCKKTLTSGSKFCPGCGAALQSKCPNCGTDVSAGGKFCGNCGSKI